MFKSLFTFAGIINAQTGTIEETWDGLPRIGIPAVIGNQNSGQQVVNIDVGKNGRVCEHKDDSRRIEVNNVTIVYCYNCYIHLHKHLFSSALFLALATNSKRNFYNLVMLSINNDKLCLYKSLYVS